MRHTDREFLCPQAGICSRTKIRSFEILQLLKNSTNRYFFTLLNCTFAVYDNALLALHSQHLGIAVRLARMVDESGEIPLLCGINYLKFKVLLQMIIFILPRFRQSGKGRKTRCPAARKPARVHLQLLVEFSRPRTPQSSHP